MYNHYETVFNYYNFVRIIYSMALSTRSEKIETNSSPLMCPFLEEDDALHNLFIK